MVEIIGRQPAPAFLFPLCVACVVGMLRSTGASWPSRLLGVPRHNFSTKTVYAPPTLDSIGRTKFPSLQLRMTLLGAPGSGKGSIGKYIAKYFNDIPIISTGKEDVYACAHMHTSYDLYCWTDTILHRLPHVPRRRHHPLRD